MKPESAGLYLQTDHIARCWCTLALIPKTSYLENSALLIQDRGSPSRKSITRCHCVKYKYVYTEVLLCNYCMSCIIWKKAAALGRRTNFTLWLCTDYSTVWKGLLSLMTLHMNLIMVAIKKTKKSSQYFVF